MPVHPVHPGAFQASFQHQLVATFHDATANRPALRLMIRSAREVILLASHTAFGEETKTRSLL